METDLKSRRTSTFLLRVTGLTNGNLSTHLEWAQLVAIEKRFVGKGLRSLISLTDSGRNQLEDHWRQLKELRKQGSAVSRKSYVPPSLRPSFS